MRVTAVILHYWEERTKNTDTIINDLRNGSRVPDSIMVFNNNEKVTMRPPEDGIIVINSNKNFGCKSRHIAALLEPSDFYLFVDDDLTVMPKTVENFENWAEKLGPSSVLGLWGKITKGGEMPYKNSQEFWANKLEDKDKAMAVNFVLGRIHGAGPEALSRGLLIGTTMGLLNDIHVEDDIILGMSNNSAVIPADEDEFFKDLEDGMVGQTRRSDHFDRRNKTVKAFIEASNRQTTNFSKEKEK